MNKYLVGIRVEGAINAYGKTKFSFRNAIIELEFGTRKKGYFNCYITLNAKSSVQAAGLANEISAEFLDILSFITSSSLAGLNVFLILKDEKGKKERVVFRQLSRQETSDIYIREDAEIKAIDEIIKIADSQDGYDLSLRWLRFGYRARTRIEQYSYYWLGFERLLSETMIERDCPFCGEKLDPYPGIDWTKAYETFSKYEKDVDEDYFKKKILKARHRVFHGGRLDAKFYEVLAEISPKVQRVIENILNERYKPSIRLDLGTPNQPNRSNTNLAYYGFITKNPNESFALDYPDDKCIENFLREPLVKDVANNIELLTPLEDYCDKW